MKTSQYILLSFIGFITAAVVVLYVDSLNVDYSESLPPITENINLGEPIMLEKHMGDFSVIVAEKDTNIQVKNDSVNTITKISKKDSVSELPFKIAYDTLYISKGVNVIKTIISCKSVKTVIGQKKSHIFFKDYKTDSLSVYTNNGVVRGYLVNDSMDYINVEANNDANMSVIASQPIDNCRLKIDSAFVRLHGQESKINNLDALLRNKSNMVLKKVEKVNLDCDSLSTYQIYDYKE